MFVVTGGAGLIGSAMVAKLNAEGITDILVVDEFGTTDNWQNLATKKIYDYVHKDTFLEAIAKSRYPTIRGVIHMGACSSTTERDVDYLMRNNYMYTRTLMEQCIKNNWRLVYASSAATYGDGRDGYDDNDALVPQLRPLNAYGFSKQILDTWALKNNLLKKCVGVKFFNVFGPNEYHKTDMWSVVYRSYSQIRRGETVKLFKSQHPDYADGEQKRDFIYVKDCVEVLWWLLNNRSVCGLYNLGTGQARSWNDLVKAVFSALKLEPKIEYVDMPPHLARQYQYFTEAKMDKLAKAGCPVKMHSLEASVRDYVCNHLEKNPYY